LQSLLTSENPDLDKLEELDAQLLSIKIENSLVPKCLNFAPNIEILIENIVKFNKKLHGICVRIFNSDRLKFDKYREYMKIIEKKIEFFKSKVSNGFFYFFIF
jgi:hypothetical protein